MRSFLQFAFMVKSPKPPIAIRLRIDQTGSTASVATRRSPVPFVPIT